MDITADLAGTQHFGGPANLDETGNFCIMDVDNSEFGQPLGNGAFLWSNGFLWSNSYTFDSELIAAVNIWVPQE